MTFDRSVRYPTKWLPPTGSFPFGVPKNSTTETSKDGSPFEKDFISDTEGFLQGLLSRRSISISGNPDTALISDYLDALGLLVGITHVTINDAVTDATLKAGMQIKTQDLVSASRGGGSNYLVKTVVQAGIDGDLIDNEVTNFVSTAVPTLALIDQIARYNATKTFEAKTWHVNASTGSDTTGTGSAALPFKTPQKAWDSLPIVILHQQTIQLADGTYNSSSIPAASQARPAILSANKKITTFRSTLVGTEIEGAVVVKGNAADPALVKIVTTSAYDFGVYVQKGNIGLNHLSIESNGVDTAAALLTAHRTDTYVHCFDVIIDGKNFSNIGIVAESTGQIELAGECHLSNSTVNVATNGDGDNITISGNSTVKDAGLFNYQIQYGNLKFIMNDPLEVGHKVSEGAGTAGFFIDNGGTVTISGQAVGVRTQIDDPIRIRNGSMDLKWCDTNGVVEVDNGSYMFYNASDFTRFVTCLGNSILKVDGTNSTTTDVIPVFLEKGSNIVYLGSNTIDGSGGAGVDFNVQTLGFNANGLTVPIQDNSDVYRIDGLGVVRTGCTIDTDGVESGRVITLEASTWDVGFVASAKMDLPAGGLSLGNTAGSFSGATLMNDAGIWRVVGLGFVR